MKHSLILFSILLLIGVDTLAQPGRMMGERPLDRIEQLRKVRLIEMLDLKEEQSVRFIARLNEFESARRQLMKERDEVLDKLERLVWNRADGKEFEKVFPEVLVVDRRIAEQKEKFFDGLQDILTAEQRAKAVIFERRFEKELREAMREARQRRRGEP